MTVANRLRVFLIVTLILPITMLNFVQAQQPIVQTTGNQPLAARSAEVSVLDGKTIGYEIRKNSPDSVLRNQESNPSLEGNGLKLPVNNGRIRRQNIRSMDILDRPNRPGHFVGNTVRRRN